MPRVRKSKVGFILDYKYEIALVIIAAILIFTNLGDRTFGGDENFGMEAVTNILSNGLPAVRNSSAINYSLTPTVNSPVSEYMMAGAVSLFGFSEFSARLPIAIFGVVSVIVMYMFALGLSKNRRTALIALILIVFSVVFYLHIRQARYYSIALLFNTVFIYAFYRYFVSGSGGRWKYILITSIILLFYTHPETAVYTSVAAVLWLLIMRNSVKLKKVFGVFVPSVILLLPLFFAVATTKTYQITAAGLPPIMQLNFSGIFALYIFTGVYYYLLFFVPFIFLFMIPKSMKKYDRRLLLLFLLVVLSHIVIASISSPFGTPSIRKLFVGTFPIDVIFLAAALNYLLDKKVVVKMLAVVLTLFLIFTNFVSLFPLAFFKAPLMQMNTPFIPDNIKDAFINKTLEPRYYFADFLYEVTHHYESTIENTLDALKGSPGMTVLYPGGFPMTPYMNERGMKISSDINDLNTIVFDWIVVESNNRILVTNSSYEKIDYSIPSYDDLWMDTADPVHHRFRSDNVPRIAVTIFHLVR